MSDAEQAAATFKGTQEKIKVVREGGWSAENGAERIKTGIETARREYFRHAASLLEDLTATAWRIAEHNKGDNYKRAGQALTDLGQIVNTESEAGRGLLAQATELREDVKKTGITGTSVAEKLGDITARAAGLQQELLDLLPEVDALHTVADSVQHHANNLNAGIGLYRGFNLGA